MATCFNLPRIDALAHATFVRGYDAVATAAWIQSLGISPHDTVRLSAQEAGGIQDVRSFVSQLLLSPQFGDVRLGIILSAELLTVQAQNALLKLLEEPPARVKLILFAQQESALLPTLLSRCQRFTSTQSVQTEGKDAQEGGLLDRFLAAETLAKRDDLPAVTAQWLIRAYEVWCADGRPLRGIAKLEQAWQLCQDCSQPTNKRLLLERNVVSSL